MKATSAQCQNHLPKGESTRPSSIQTPSLSLSSPRAPPSPSLDTEPSSTHQFLDPIRDRDLISLKKILPLSSAKRTRQGPCDCSMSQGTAKRKRKDTTSPSNIGFPSPLPAPKPKDDAMNRIAREWVLFELESKRLLALVLTIYQLLPSRQLQ